MIKRANKITALLVAITSIMSTTPAFAKADRLTENEGEISSVIAFKDGKYLYQGSKNDKEYGVYYNDGANENLLEDVDDLDTAIKYGDSYALFPDSKDEYKVDLNTGKVIKDEDSREDDLVTAKTKLESKLSKTKRYGKDTEILSFKEVSADTNMFGNDQWYEYTATGNPNYVDDLDDSDNDTDNEVDNDNEESKTKIKVEINAFYSDITIAGKTFSPSWGNDLPASIKTAVEAADFGEYKVESVESETKEGDQNSGKVTIIFTTSEQLKELPDGFVKFGGSVPDWEMTAGIMEDEETLTKIKVEINAFYSDITIAEKTFSPSWGNDLPASIKSAVESADFGKYKVESVESETNEGDQNSGKVTIIFTTSEQLKELPDGFVKFGGNVPEWQVTAGIMEDEDILNGIKVEINAFYSDITILGKTFSPSWGNDLPASIKTAVEAADFGEYKVGFVKSETNEGDQNSGKVTIIFTINKELSSVPNGFVQFGGSTSNNEIVSSILSEEELEEFLKDDEENNSGQDQEEKVVYYGYTDGKGNYIDCSKIANLKVFNGEKSVKAENFNEKIVTESKKDGKKLKVKVGLPTIEATLGQDDNFIYSLISVPIVGAQPENGSSYKPDAETELKYIQKISKKQQEKEGGAYLPSDIDSFQMNNNTGWDEGDNWAYMAAYYIIDESLAEFGDNRGIRIIDGDIYVAHSTTDDDGDPAVSFGKLKLKKSSKVYLLDEERTLIEPLVFEDYANEGKADNWTIDINGNVWSIFNGKIRKSAQGNEFQELYRCDGSMNRLEVYDENNLVAWEDGGEYYATADDIRISSSKLQVTTDIKTGWQKAEDGTWHVYDLSGNETKGWLNYNSSWYYFNNKGVMQTGWVNNGEKYYYLASTGVMKIGWIQIEDKWYYLDESGARQENTTINGYALDENGVWIK